MAVGGIGVNGSAFPAPLIAALKRLQAADPALTASIDQASANIRDTLDDLGVNLLNEREMRAVLAGALLFHTMTGQQHQNKMLSLALSIGAHL